VGDLTRLSDVATPPPPPTAQPVRRPLDAFVQLMRWGWVLLRHDALVPREITPILPPGARLLAGFVHLFAGRDARTGRPGQRLGRAFEHLGPVAIKLGQVLATRADIFGSSPATWAA
jgi:ubiquinone biosynthesis protein